MTSSEHRLGDVTLRVLRDRCIGSAACMKLAPEVFEFDDERICSVREDAEPIEMERLRESCALCPVDALVLIDATGKQQVPAP